MLAAPLAGLRVLNTRPAHQAAALSAALQAQGAQVQGLPLLAIQPLAQPAATLAALHAASSAHFWVCTSRNAVAQALALLPAPHWPRRCYALGAGTASALAAQGIAAIALAGGSSEELLALPELQQLAQQRGAIITGQGGRNALQAPLSARGAQLHTVPVYRRIPAASPTQIRLACTWAQAAIITSGEALQLAHQAAGSALHRLPLVLPSARVAALARQLGVQQVAIAQPVSVAGMVAALTRLFAAPVQ